MIVTDACRGVSGRSRLLCLLMALAFTAIWVDRVQAEPAPALSEVRVVGVASTSYLNGTKWNEVPVGAISTPNDHGGTWVNVAVLERGYGQNSMAFFNGTRMTLYQSEPLIGQDRKIWGYIRYYRLNVKFTSGTVTSQAASINGPFRTLSTRLNVR